MTAGVLLVTASAAPVQAAPPARDDFDPLRYLPANSASANVVRGKEAALRYGLGRRFELTLQVNNAFAPQNRRAIGRAEALIAGIPGVRRVIGPSGLLTFALDTGGRVSSAPLLAGGRGDDASEAVRQRLIRRSDAVGWFISRTGTEIRLLVETDDLASVQSDIETTAASSGLVLLSGVAPASPLWPEPDRNPRPFPAWVPFLLMAVAMAPGAWAAGRLGRLTIPRAMLVTLVAGVAATAPALFAPAGGIRRMSLAFGTAAALLALVLVALFRVARTLGATRGQGRRGQDRLDDDRTRMRVPLAILVPSLLLVSTAVALLPNVSMGTLLWRKTSLFFVEVRGDMNEPVVLREVRRLTDFLRTEPGVAHAWSVADLFFAVPTGGEGFGGIPSSSETVRAILARARNDSAVSLELAPDHSGALVGVRLDDQSGVDRATVLEHLETYLVHEHRQALRRIDVSDARVPPPVRGLGRGILAADARERILRICARSGRMLSDGDVQRIEEASRRAALVPVVEPGRLRGEIFQETSAFLERAAIAAAHVALPRPGERQRLADELFAQPADARVADVGILLGAIWGRQLPPAVLRAHATELHARLAEVRRGHSARLHFNDVLFGADLPTEGVLSEEVRDAMLDAMGPIAGVPTAVSTPGAFSLDAMAIGGAPSDRILSLAWMPRVSWGVALAAAVTALVLAALGGLAALAWLPAALAPAAPLVIFPALASLPVGALYMAILAGALAGGAALAVAFAPGRRDL